MFLDTVEKFLYATAVIVRTAVGHEMRFQTELNEEARQALDEAEERLQQGIQRLKEAKLWSGMMEECQSSWLRLKSLQVRLLGRSPGSMHPMVVNVFLEEMVRERIAELRRVVGTVLWYREGMDPKHVEAIFEGEPVAERTKADHLG